MQHSIYGSITYRNKLYPFFLEGRRVNIVARAWEYYEDFKDVDEEESISGVTADNRQILFLRCKFGCSLFQSEVWFFPAGYVLSSRNVGNPYDFTFEKVSFYSDALNEFFPPQKAIISDFDPHNWDGGMTIKLKPFEETAISFDYRECKCELNVSRYINARPGKSYIGNADSVFSFEFNTVKQCKELIQYWLALFDFLSFINYGTDITFSKITLANRGEGGFAHCADAYIFSNNGEYLPRSILHTITVDDIPLERLGAMFSKIASIRGNDRRLDYYFPDSYKEGFRIDPSQWLVSAVSFEGLFKSCYPSFKQNEKKQFKAAKSAALDALNAVDQREMSKKEKRYFDDCKSEIERYEGLLSEMLVFIVKKKYKYALNDFLALNRKKYEMDEDSYGEIYSKYRNKVAHGDIEPIGEKQGAVYRVLQAAIYFLLLEGTELDNDTLRVIAKKLFLENPT